jgi:hypothetical protein
VIAHTRQPGPGGSLGGLLPAISPSPTPAAPVPGVPPARGRITSVAADTAFASRRLPGTLILVAVAFAVALAGSGAGLGVFRRVRKRRAP